MKRTTKHTIYEIWNEYTAESVFTIRKPTKEEVMTICKKEWSPLSAFGSCSPEEYVNKYVHVEKLQHVYAPQV